MIRQFGLVVIVGSFMVGCASKPILNPNDKYNRVGHERSEKDIEHCENLAESQLKKTQGRRISRSALKGAGIGALMGAVGGSSGHAGTLGGAAIGGAAGAAGGAIGGALETPEGARRGLVQYCLKKKGYSVAGWE